MSEGGDSYDPGPWKGYDYKSAWAAYGSDVGYSSPSSASSASTGGAFGTPGAPSVSKSVKAKKSVVKPTLDDLLPAKISTNARSPIAILLDGTGSFGRQDVMTVLEKLPLLDLGVKDYLDDVEISVALVGDAGSDQYPLQVRNFTKGKGLVDALATFKIECNGGGNEKESYDLGALYYARNCETPKAVKPVLIYVCDEGLYDHVSKDWAEEHARTGIESGMKTKKLFDELKQQWSVYCIRKHYGGEVKDDKMYGSNLAIQKQWESYLGADRIAVLNDPRRVVDVILGLLAHETDKMDFFGQELAERQTPAQVAAVQKSMLTIGKKPVALLPAKGKSVLKLGGEP